MGRPKAPLIIEGARFLMEDGSIADPILYCHLETKVFSVSLTAYLLKTVAADAAGLTFSGISSILGDLPYNNPGNAYMIYPFTGITRILRSTWTIYYRTYTTGGTVYPEILGGVQAWAQDGAFMKLIVPGPTARSAVAEGSSYATQSGTLGMPGYTVPNQLWYLALEWGYYVSKTKSGATNYLRVDDNALAVADQARAENVMFARGLRLLKTRGGYNQTRLMRKVRARLT